MNYQKQSIVLLLLLLNVQGTQLVSHHQRQKWYRRHHNMVQLDQHGILNPDVIDETIAADGFNFQKGITDETMAYQLTKNDQLLIKDMHQLQQQEDGELDDGKAKEEAEKKKKEAQKQKSPDEIDETMGFTEIAKKRQEIMKRDPKEFEKIQKQQEALQKMKPKKEEAKKEENASEDDKKEQSKTEEHKDYLGETIALQKQKDQLKQTMFKKLNSLSQEPKSKQLLKTKTSKKKKHQKQKQKSKEQSIQSYLDAVNEIDSDNQKATKIRADQQAVKEEKLQKMHEKEEVLDSIWSDKLQQNNEDTGNQLENYIDNQTKLENKMKLDELVDPSTYDLPTINNLLAMHDQM